VGLEGGAFAPDVNGTVHAIAVQADGRILIGGVFTQVNGVSRTYLARLFPDGSLDASFAPMLSGIAVYDIVVLDNSDILIGGSFSTVNGATQHDIVRLTTDGQIVPGFSSPPTWMKFIALQYCRTANISARRTIVSCASTPMARWTGLYRS
jgi:hypothetical protein